MAQFSQFGGTWSFRTSVSSSWQPWLSFFQRCLFIVGWPFCFLQPSILWYGRYGSWSKFLRGELRLKNTMLRATRCWTSKDTMPLAAPGRFGSDSDPDNSQHTSAMLRLVAGYRPSRPWKYTWDWYVRDVWLLKHAKVSYSALRAFLLASLGLQFTFSFSLPVAIRLFNGHGFMPALLETISERHWYTHYEACAHSWRVLLKFLSRAVRLRVSTKLWWKLCQAWRGVRTKNKRRLWWFEKVRTQKDDTAFVKSGFSFSPCLSPSNMVRLPDLRLWSHRWWAKYGWMCPFIPSIRPETGVTKDSFDRTKQSPKLRKTLMDRCNQTLVRSSTIWALSSMKCSRTS